MIKHSPLVCSIIIIASSWPFLFLYHDFYLLTYFVCSIEAQRFKPWNLQAQVQSSNKNDVEILIRFITTTIVACFAVCLKCVRVELCAWVSQYIDIDTLIWLSLSVSLIQEVQDLILLNLIWLCFELWHSVFR